MYIYYTCTEVYAHLPFRSNINAILFLKEKHILTHRTLHCICAISIILKI